MRIGIISPSEIAFRRFLPALTKHGKFTYAGVAVPSAQDWNGEGTKTDTAFDSIHTREYEKAISFKDNFGGEIFEGYSTLINNPEIEALYIPLPPALHYKWAKKRCSPVNMFLSKSHPRVALPTPQNSLR